MLMFAPEQQTNQNKEYNMNFGWKPGKEDFNDYSFSDIKSGLIKIASSSGNEHVIQEFTPISNQLKLGSCVANATVDALEILMGLTGNVTQLSRLFVYWNARLYDGTTNLDEGTYIKNAFASLSKDGVCPESVWEYNVNKVFAQPPLEAYRQGSDNTIDSYYRIKSSGSQRLDEIAAAVRANHPVVFGTGVTNSFLTYYNDNSVVWAAPKDKIVGLHAMIITGVREVNGELQFLVRNSWGSSWGDQGHTWFESSYILHESTGDIWVPTLMTGLM